MRFVAIAALAATFWLAVATVRLIAARERGREAEHARVALIAKLAAQKPPELIGPLPPRPVKAFEEPCHLGDISSSAEPLPDNRLPKAALVAGLDAVRPRIRACYARFGVPGTVLVNLVIAGTGQVASAAATGRFSDTPTGACVEAAVKTARFPRSEGGFATPYPFQLR